MSPRDGETRAPRVVLQRPRGSAPGWWVLESPDEVLVAHTLSEVRPILQRAIQASEAGAIAAGFLSYEAAPAFDAAMRVRPGYNQPLAWFGVFQDAEELEDLPDTPSDPATSSWIASETETEYERSVRQIHHHIARGDTYQVNLTLRLKALMHRDPWQLFASLVRGQRADCGAYVDTGDWILCSASPELFFELEASRIRCKPMKGTAPRGRTLEEDLDRARWLRSSAKNRAENVMIVDMVRNDLGRIAAADTVRVTQLCELEKYPSLYQLTSTVEARTEAGLEEIFSALFPCASITGAPKIRAMEIIRNLETSPRGVYTGAIGLLGPGRRARFNVAIRTVQIDTRSSRAIYGTGGGIVWDSVAQDEWRECQTKALVLEPPPPEFELLETLLWEPDEGFFLLTRHLDRLHASASYFDFRFDRQQIERQLDHRAQQLTHKPHRIRLLLDSRGQIRLEVCELEHSRRPWRLGIATEPIDAADRFLFHKTTHRQVYDQHRDRRADCDDVLLWNEHREITESTLANVVVRFGERLLTPPIECGLLGGTFRAELIERGRVAEAVIPLAQLGAADEVLLINSVRRWIPTDLAPGPTTPAAETHSPESA